MCLLYFPNLSIIHLYPDVTSPIATTAKQSPFWEKFRKAMVVNPDSSTGNWVREFLLPLLARRSFIVVHLFGQPCDRAGTDCGELLQITKKFRNPEPGSRPEKFSIPPSKGVHAQARTVVLQSLTIHEQTLSLVASDPAQNAYYERDYR